MLEFNEIMNSAMELPLHQRAYLARILLESVNWKKTDSWADTVKELAGTWRDFPSIEQLRSSERI